MLLTFDMVKLYEECPMAYRRAYVEDCECVITWDQMQRRSYRAAMHADFRARMNGGMGLDVERMLFEYEKTQEALLLQSEVPITPKRIRGCKHKAFLHFRDYLRDIGPVVVPKEVGVTVSRKLDDELELQCDVDAVMEREVVVIDQTFWIPNSRLIANHLNLLMASLVTGVGNTVLIHFVYISQSGPRRFNICFTPERLKWYERYLRSMSDAIKANVFPACGPYRARCTDRVCQFYWSCRGAVE